MSSTHHGILIHAVFSTKFRQKIIHQSWEQELWKYIGGLAHEHKAILLAAGGIEDHIHLLLRIHPSFAISDTMKLLKANSSRWVNESRKIRTKFEWQRGYGAFSVSQSMADVVKGYIGRQREHHRTMTFREEYLEMLKRHEIEFDERYVFDEEILG